MLPHRRPASRLTSDCYCRGRHQTRALRLRSPYLNAYAERFVLSIKSECLDRIGMLGEPHLRRAIASYVEHYHLERCHQGIGNRLIDGIPGLASGPVARRERLGGILSHYYREAA